MANPPNVFSDATILRTALYDLLANDAELFSQIAVATIAATEWLANSWTPTYVSASSFTVPADQTAQYLVGRAVRAHLASGYVKAYVQAASFSAGTGLTTVTLDAAVLTNTLDETRLGILNPGASAPSDLAPKTWAQNLVATRPRLVTSWRIHDTDLNQPENGTLGATGTIDFADGALRRIKLQERVLDPGYNLRLVLLLAMDTTQAAAISLNLAYKVFSAGDSHGVAVELWQASKVYSAGATVIGLASDGWRVYTAAGGTSGATEPAWPTSGTIADNGWNWTAGAVVYKNLPLSFTVSTNANQGFVVDSASLQIPAAELTANTQEVVGFLWRAASDAHGGNMKLIDGWCLPVGV
jgi:hypothetical protein